MLFVWDIHITSKHASKLLDHVRAMVNTNPTEQHIVFLGDYVYHFSYERKTLLQLFSLFIELASQGKILYIVAGNHDWIAGHFVFEEARQALLFTWSTHIHFITQPRLTTIQWVECLFLPFYRPDEAEIPTHDLFPHLYDDTHPQRLISRKINNILASHLAHRQENKKTDRLLIIHHRYIAKTKLPGQQAVFSYESPALDPQFFENPSLWFVSWHLHEPFCYKQYLCTWSLRNTSPLEVNQQKFVFVLQEKSWEIDAYPVQYNPYLQIPYPEHPLTKDAITLALQENFTRIKDQLNAGVWKINSHDLEAQELSSMTITITTEHQSVQDLPQAFDPEVLKEIWTIRHKLLNHTDISLVNELDRASLDLTNRFSDRKILLRRFLEQKYWSTADRYFQLLEDEKLL